MKFFEAQQDDVDELVGLADAHGDEATEILDDLVHDCKSEEAASINNEGREAQVRYLIESLGVVEARQQIVESGGDDEDEDEEVYQGGGDIPLFDDNGTPITDDDGNFIYDEDDL